MVMGLQNKLEVHDDGDSSCGFLPVIKRWWLDSRACKSNFRSGFLFSNSSLGLFCITKTFFFFNWGQQPSKLLFPPFIRCRHIMSGIMTKLAKKKNPCFSSTTRLTMHYCTKESGRLAFFPHSSWGSTSSAQRKTGKNALRSSNQVYSISKPNELVN